MDSPVGWSIAAEAAEALYRSEHRFRIDAGLLLGFLAKCPSFQGARPGSLIRKILLNIDEDAHFIGEGRDKQGLRRADWVILDEGESGYQRQPRSQRNMLMQKCWKALLTMPHLRSLEVHIMPVEGLLPVREVKYFEVRDIAPSVFRLWAKGSFHPIPLRIERKQVFTNWYPRGIHGSESVQISNTRFTTFHISSQFLLDSTKAGSMNCVKLRRHLNLAHPSVRKFWKSRGLPQREDLTYDQKRIIHQSKLDGLRDRLYVSNLIKVSLTGAVAFYMKTFLN